MLAHNPAAWEMMFDAVPSKNLGLDWEPCHQMIELIDPLPQLREWVKIWRFQLDRHHQ
jgi:sugar phosphate isomerase/epimerase